MATPASQSTRKTKRRMLIEIEGPRGAGKSTLIENLCSANACSSTQRFISAAALEQRGTEPGWLIGALMRSLNEPLEGREAVFLYCARTAARARVIRGLLAPGTVVLSDRLCLSLHVQASLSGISPADVRTLMRLTMHEVEPDYTVLLDTDYAAHHRRLTGQGRDPQPELDFCESRARFTHAYGHLTRPKLYVSTADMTPQEVQAAVVGGLRLAGPVP
jgi:thymidylate kinase